ncbi:MAG: 6-carboxytetrahydropterin synthase QueD [Spirochaetota bacterium]|nr:6-carboxytetrahydropterin synthase QueD [Spirochaetota bacterium]
MFRIKVIDHFSAAHQLIGYPGRCEGLHGHNWKVEVEAEGEKLDEIGMLVDFKELKNLLHGVLKEIDHQHLNALEPFRNPNPSAELIARYIYYQLKSIIPPFVYLVSVSVWESESSRASYYE